MQALLCPACGTANSEFDIRCAGCGATLSTSTAEAGKTGGEDPLIGRQISHFRVIRRIGQGGMGVVYQAVDLALGREVALKFLHGERPRDEIRFQREAQAAAALDHPGIGTVYETGEHEGRRFIAMAFYDGETLAQRLARLPDRRLPLAEAAAVAGQLAAALAAAHGAGIVHRDLKPENVMILPDGRLKLLDFGLAKWRDSPSVTEQGIAVGTAAYMAPEQLRGEATGPAVDLWALGVMLSEMLTGRHPFGGERRGMIHSIQFEEPVPLREARPEVPSALERIVSRCLAKSPADRSGASEILNELRAGGWWDSGSGGLIAPPRRNRRRRGAWAVAAALGMLAAGAATWLWMRPPEPPVYVAVLKPELGGSLAEGESARVKANLQAALLRTIAALDGLAAVDSAQVNAVQGPPAAVARAVAAGEVVASRADCAGDLCQVSLRRLAGDDGRILWTDALQLPPSKPRLFADAVAVALRQGYMGRDLRVPRLELETGEEEYRNYLDLRRQAADPAAYREVLERLGALRSKAPDFLEIYSLEANVARRLYLLHGDAHYLERGIAVASQAHERAPGDPRPLANLFDLYLDAGSYPQAEAVLAQLSAVDPAGSLLRRGQLAERRGRPQEALELLAEAVRLQPSWRSLLILANAEYRQGRLEDARRHLAELLRRAPGNLEGLKALAQIELLSDPDRAVVLLRQIAASTPDTDALANLGAALLLRRRYDEAEESFRRALQLQPGSPAATLNLADCLLLQGHSVEARALYSGIVDQAERAGWGDWENLGTKAQALAHLGEPTRAVETIQQALRLTPDNAQLAYEAAVVYTVVGDQNSALVLARRAAAGGVGAYWFALPFFDALRAKPAFQALTSSSADG
jgi:eukaryotic-like serine/threonine-protein kinase